MHVLNQAVRQDGLTSSEAATEHDVEVAADTALDLQSEVFKIPVAVSQALQDLDLVVRPLKPVGTDAVLPRLQDSLSSAVQHPSEPFGLLKVVFLSDLFEEFTGQRQLGFGFFR